MPNQHGYEKVVNTLAQEIFSGKLKPETKLPTEKQLAEDMNIDRTSLRVGLKQLESMKVISIRQGDGIYVRDYLKTAGLDFLGFTFQQIEAENNQLAIDAYILDEIWEFWITFFPPVLELALKRGSTRDIRRLADLVSQQGECIAVNDREKMVELGILIQDGVAEVVNNTIVLLMFNSSRPLRKKILEILIYSMDENGLREMVENERLFAQKALKGSDPEIKEALELLRVHYGSYRQRLRESMGN